MDTTEDSFETYKKYLEDSIGIANVEAPPRPLTPYLRFYFERSCEEKAKNNPKMNELTRSLASEWKELPAKKK